jgi:2'-5' RNA ligase
MTRPETLHLTLVFIGDLARERLPELVAALAEIRVSQFVALFDRAHCWRHNRIGFLASTTPPEPLLELVSQIESALDRLAIPFDRRPYKPHVTLIRKAACEKGIPAQNRDSASPEWAHIAPISWSAEDFVLVESALTSAGPAYCTVERFPLS